MSLLAGRPFFSDGPCPILSFFFNGEPPAENMTAFAIGVKVETVRIARPDSFKLVTKRS
jgi:hypothetical protein